MTSLRTKARLPLEGSDRSEEALTCVCEYIDDVRKRIVDPLACNDIDAAVELLVLLGQLHSAFDPVGNSPYKLQVVPRRKGPGAPPNPAAKSSRETDAMFAAAYADRLIRENPDKLKKDANSRAAGRFGVTIGEVHAARKLPLYLRLSQSEASEK